jgi:hypothetical protein
MRSRRLGIVLLASLGAVAALVAGGWYATWYCYPTVQPDPQDAPAFRPNQEQHTSRGYGADSARIDSQITFRIPDGQAQAVYEYLKGKYVGKSGILADQFPGINLHGQQMSDVSLFTDEYFDTPAFDLFRTRNSARHRTRLNTTNPEDRKSGRELVQMKITPPGKFTLRSEYKYKVERSGKRKSIDDLHPLISLVSKPLREDFKKVFTDAGIDPYSLKHVFTIHQTRSRGYFNWDDTNIMSFSVDEGSASILWAEGRFASVDLGLVEIAYTEGDEAKREKMWAIRDAIVQDLLDHFPDLTQTSDSKYGIVLNQLMSQIPPIPALFRLM